ncbi:zeatin O-glucosyltransferase-like isoform X3 [Diospyros lotus]|uniref:zeatin O-glucosyltransferase-like isoform X3 n=1 Tax=Diospyros lotus TaxID=55363 RepID=UPI002259205A|nr:zeatin O-glucosyltransferase-like isoform X3 [Diospyros lotus]
MLDTTHSMANHHQNEPENGPKQPEVMVVMVPLTAQGHLNQLLHFSRLICAYNIPVHYLSYAVHIRQAKLRVHGWDPAAVPNLHFHECPAPSFPSPPPNPNSPTNFPVHLLPLFDSSSDLREPVTSLLRSLSAAARKIVVVYDSVMGSVVQDVESIPNAECYEFLSLSAFFHFFFFWELMRKPMAIDAEVLEGLPTLEGCFTPESTEFIAKQLDFGKFRAGYLLNTCKAIEGRYIDLLAKSEILNTDKLWAIGPFHPLTLNKDHNHFKPRHECLEWLDKQAPNSVIYVSFGTTTSLSDGQIKELADGLERSHQKFIWVLRDADRGDIFAGEGETTARKEKLAAETFQGRGMVVADWAPQLEVLAHPSTGGFLTHCGWNSCMESISMGVPMAAWPMHSDQPRNAHLVAKMLGIGLVVRDWERRKEVIGASEVEDVVRRLMDSDEGERMRKRAGELGSAVRLEAAEGCVSCRELDSFVAQIFRF